MVTVTVMVTAAVAVVATPMCSVSGAGSMAGRGGGDDEFDRALEDFDDIISEEQGAIARESGRAADEGTPGAAGGGGGFPTSGGSESGERAPIGGPTGEPPDRTAAQVEGCNDSDTVARQLCEAALRRRIRFCAPPCGMNITSTSVFWRANKGRRLVGRCN